MPSPFPGMDPYLEHPDIFSDFHDSFIAYLREVIQSQLPAPYFAAIGRRTWIQISERFIGPDVQVLQQPAETEGAGGGVSLAVQPSAHPLVIHVPHDEQVEPLIEIYTGRGSDRRLVTAIEVLSLSNKTPGQHGRDLYLRKQREILQSQVHSVEIDLLRGGEHTTAVPKDRFESAAVPYDYHVCIHHYDNLEDYFVYPFQLAETLPEISVPLLPGEEQVPVALQQVLQRTYDAGPYSREIDYQVDSPVPPLSADQSAWAAGVLGARG